MYYSIIKYSIVNSKEKEDWQRNCSILNEMLSKLKSYKQVDPVKLSKGNFSINFEFVQFLYDYIVKTTGSDKPKKYNGLERRIEILKAQFGTKVSTDYKKYLPTHLLTNEILLQIDKEKYFNNSTNSHNLSLSQQITESQNKKEDNALSSKLEKYKVFFRLLEEDLNYYVEQNEVLQEETSEGEGRRQYYLDKLVKILQFCEKKSEKKHSANGTKILNDIIKIIEYVPDDFN